MQGVAAHVHSAELGFESVSEQEAGLPSLLPFNPPPETSRTPPARLTDKTQDTHAISCTPTAPSTGPGIQLVPNKCLQNG